MATLSRRIGSVVRRSAPNCTAMRKMGGGAIRPPFARTPVPTQPLHEEHELIWDDGVAAETCLDFDAVHISSSEGLKWWIGGFAFFFSIFTVAGFTNPAAQNPAVARGSEGVELPFGGAFLALGGDPDAAPVVEDDDE
eukprot:CAMPEP_0171648306 /NCGR_PEP_ID=MMETSP0990-20121206/36030_1 /TAXON_ID=483369 /ORGANISM="non described non described, Strain CCMP2098" /LENGTH=137 /DNA_ID=CAMNT_0012225809 /DNA_START=22 /DNA_END=435 /DNA_ORIENTATION=+